MSQRPIHIDLAPSDPANIRAQDDAFWLAGLLGATGNNISCILPVGNRFAISKTSNNEVVLQSGAYVMQGFVIEIPDSESFAIASGAQGKKRLDLIVAEYKKGTPRSAYSLKVIQGTQGDDYIAPELTVQDLHAGGTTRQEKIAEVKIDGIDIVSQVITAITIRGISELAGLIADHNHDTKYLGKTDKAADSAKLDGREVSNIPVAGGIPAWSTPDKILQATKFKEDGVDLKNKYWPLKSILPSTLNANNLLDEGVYFSNGTAFTNIPATTSGTYAVLVVRRRNSGGLDPVIQEFYTTDGRHFVRSKANNVWNAWKCTTVKYGTGTPPSSLAPGEIYVQY